MNLSVILKPFIKEKIKKYHILEFYNTEQLNPHTCTLTLIPVQNINKTFEKNSALILIALHQNNYALFYISTLKLKKGLHNTYHIKVFEGLYITLNKPTINKQHEHKNMKFLSK